MLGRRSVLDKILLRKNLGIICLSLIIFASFYYPIGAVLIIAMGVPSTPVNMGIKLLIAILAVLLIIIGILSNRNQLSLPKALWAILTFWAIYSMRILYDLNRGITFSGYPNIMVYGFAFGAILLPILAIVLWRSDIDITNLPKIMLAFFTLACIMIFVTMIIKAGGFQFEMFLIRPHLKSGSAEQKNHVLNPIQIGLYGEMLAIVSLYLVLIAKKTWNIFYVPFLLFGVMLVFLGASRGPFVSFILCALVLIFYRYRISKAKLVLTLKYALIFSAITYTVAQSFSASDFMMVGRMRQFAEGRGEDKKEYRDYQFASAWQDFLDSPVYGKQFVGTYDRFYPHNIILEVLMSTGLMGGILFFYFFFAVFYKFWRAFKLKDDKTFFIGILALPIILGSMFSGCLFQSVDLWLMMILFIAMPMQRKKFKKVKVSKNYALQ